MDNGTKIKIPKKYQSMLNEVSYDGDGYWGYSADGYEFSSTGCHTAHGTTQSELLRDIRTLTSCSCNKCAEKLALK